MFSAFGITGAGGRSKNNDRIMLCGAVGTDTLECVRNDFIIAVVCDGVGVNEGSDIAADIAAKTLCRLDDADKSKAQAAIEDANGKIISMQKENSLYNTMASTVAGLVLSGEDSLIFNVGDTKVFRLRDEILNELSTEHSYIQLMVDAGVIENKSEVPPSDRHTITRALGSAGSHEPSFEGGKSRVLTGDVYLVCSDGLSDFVSKNKIIQVLESKEILREKGKRLFELAQKNNATDNISLIIVEVK